jgi:hypothetical protein
MVMQVGCSAVRLHTARGCLSTSLKTSNAAKATQVRAARDARRVRYGAVVVAGD